MAGKKTKKLVFGVGLNDFPEHWRGQMYRTWQSMLSRCYSESYQMLYPTYVGCSVDPEWLVLSGFKSYFDNNYKDGYVLDKDLLFTGNKIYTKGRCLFIPQSLNKFTNDHGARRGMYPIGVSHHEGSLYQSQISHNGKQKSLGLFSDPMMAHKAWFEKKMAIAFEYKDMCDEIHDDLFAGVINKINSMRVKS